MSSSHFSSADNQDGHLRTRLDPHDRFSAMSDTPSVYSRANLDITDTRPARERLRDPQVSTLDLSDDSRRSSMNTAESYDEDPHSFEDSSDEPADRMSYLGPKMRFHSRAPWEEADALAEQDEPADSPKPLGFPFSFGGHVKDKGGSSPTSSPRQSHSRPSVDSYRSGVPPKRSFDTINSQMSSRGALYTLAQESMSAASLNNKPGGPASKDSSFAKFSSLGRSHAPKASNPPNLAPSPPVTPQPSPGRSPLTHRTHTGKTSSDDSDTPNHATYDPNRSRPSASGFSWGETHPYANPDLVGKYEKPWPAVQTPPVSPHRSQFPRGSLSGPQTNEATRSKPTPVAVHATAPRSRMSSASVASKVISSPIAVQGSSLPPIISGNISTPIVEHPGGSVARWTDRNVVPSFSLISLEEARAQRARSPVTSSDLSRTLSSSTVATDATTTEDLDLTIVSSTSTTRSRGRTISAGTKAINAIQTIVGGTKYDRREFEPPVTSPTNVSHPGGKTLKHKKSGFMRLFNGGKDKEIEEAPPPVPIVAPLPPSSSGSMKKRVPVPSIASFETTSTQTGPHRSTSTASTVARPTPPVLQINTMHNRGAASDGGRVPQSLLTAISTTNPPSMPWLNKGQPQSAPADIANFPTLRLRPVSSLFSTDYEYIVPDTTLQSNASDHYNVATPTSFSPNGPMLPLTPGAFDGLDKLDCNDPTATIRYLHEQLASSKLASQRQIWELECQIKELKEEMGQLQSKQAHCGRCGHHTSYNSESPPSSGGSASNHGRSVIHRPRAKTGGNARFVNAHS